MSRLKTQLHKINVFSGKYPTTFFALVFATTIIFLPSLIFGVYTYSSYSETVTASITAFKEYKDAEGEAYNKLVCEYNYNEEEYKTEFSEFSFGDISKEQLPKNVKIYINPNKPQKANVARISPITIFIFSISLFVYALTPFVYISEKKHGPMDLPQAWDSAGI